MTRLGPGLELLPSLTLLRPLGRGGMGEAWLARDRDRGEDVVAKVLPADAPAERRALLRREARLVRKLSHPGIVPVLGFVASEHGSAVLLPYLPGGDASRLRGGAPLAIVRAARDVADALAYLHALGVVHRDVKATNVLLDAEGRAHLADFGIASIAAGSDLPRDDDEGVVIRGGGSRASMSPEQRAGEPPHPADDAYALGVLLYDLLAGRPPFAPGASEIELRTAEPPPLPAALAIPRSLRALVAMMLAREPDMRPGSMATVRDALSGIETELLSAVAPAAPPEGPRKPDVRLQPPPRAPEIAVASSAPHAASGADGGPALLRRGGLTAAQIALLAFLALAAALVVLVAPRWALPPSPSLPAPPAAEPSSAPDSAVAASPPNPVEPPAPAASSALESARPPAKATPEPAGPAPVRAAPGPSRPAPPDRAAFSAAMSEGQAALERRDWDKARAAFERAGALEPGSSQAQDGLVRVESGRRTEALVRHRENAARLESGEDWKGAVAEHDAALQIDPHVAFALEGRERAAGRATLADALAFHIRNPQRLSTDAVGAEAERLLDRAREVPSPGPLHREQIAALEAQLARARTPVPVVLESDGLTEVVVSRVGRLGAFKRRALELRPGTYAVVGSRRGYRDVRRQIVVAPGAPTPVLQVRCEETI